MDVTGFVLIALLLLVAIADKLGVIDAQYPEDLEHKDPS